MQHYRSDDQDLCQEPTFSVDSDKVMLYMSMYFCMFMNYAFGMQIRYGEVVFIA